MSFDKKLQSLRKTAGLSQEELASELGVSRQAVSKWESGTSYPEMDKLILMTRLFKCSLDDLVNDEVRDSSIIKNKVNKGQTYIDSLLEFITKSINMFTSMKASAALKVFLELILLTFIIVCISVVMYSAGEALLFKLFYNGHFYSIYVFLASVLLAVIVALDVIIIFQFYKIRYLDYYDRLVYKFEVGSSDKDGNETVKEDKLEQDEGNALKKKERIIIRDPEHRPLAFLSFISTMILLIYKCIILMATIPFIFLLLFLTVAVVVLIYLISYNVIFVGISIACVAAIVLTILVIRTLNQHFFKKIYPVKLMFWVLIVSLLVGSLGIGFSVIALKNIEFREVNSLDVITKEYPFSDKLYLNFFGTSDDDILTFVVEDARNDIAIDISYDSNYIDFEFDNPAGDANYLTLTKKYNDSFSSKKEINTFLDNLKKNIILENNNYSDYSDVSVRASEKHIKSLINTISDYADIYTTIDRRNGYTYYYVRETITDDDATKVCGQDDYYRKCIKVINNTFDVNFKFEYKDNKLVYNENKYSCYIIRNGYVCTKKAISNDLD